MPKLPISKDPDKLIIFAIETPRSISDEQTAEIIKYLNHDTSYNVKILPISSEEYKKPIIRCIFPVVPNEEILSLLSKVASGEDEIAREAKSILRMLKIQKIKD